MAFCCTVLAAETQAGTQVSCSCFVLQNGSSEIFFLLKLKLSADCRPKKAGTAPAGPTPLGKHGNRYESIFSHKSWERLSCGLQKDLSVSPICKGATNSLCANLRMCSSA